MNELLRRFRGVGIALAVLALSAGVAFAAAGPANFHANLAGANNPTASHEPDASEVPDATDAPESNAPESPDASGAPADTHGGLVSTAAQMSTPPGFSNHGAFVSCVARMRGVTLTGFNWSSVTPASCTADQPGNGHGGH